MSNAEPSITDAPKVFISHASEDKARFVEQFAARLRERGVDAWYDQWEMMPGDSLVDKIFEEGIKNAAAVIVILSKFSVTKPWVREELNASFVQRINGKSKLIPVIIEECDIPVTLLSTLWQRIPNLLSYDQEFSRIVNAILGITDKPAIGSLPPHSTLPIVLVHGLNSQDSLVLKLAGDQYVSTEQHVLEPDSLFAAADNLGISSKEFQESAEVLEKHGYLKVVGGIGRSVLAINIQSPGFQAYARTYVADFTRLYKDVVFQLVNRALYDSSDIAEALHKPDFMVIEILLDLSDRNLITLAKGSQRLYMSVTKVSVELRRSLD